jgi:hypothetical protein
MHKSSLRVLSRVGRLAQEAFLAASQFQRNDVIIISETVR